MQKITNINDLKINGIYAFNDDKAIYKLLGFTSDNELIVRFIASGEISIFTFQRHVIYEIRNEVVVNKPKIQEEMTLKDYFAGQFLQGYFASGKVPVSDADSDRVITYGELLAKRAYDMANAMLKHRAIENNEIEEA